MVLTGTLIAQALLGGGRHVDLNKFQHTLWDILTKGDSVKVSCIILHFQHPVLFLSLFLAIVLANYILNHSFIPVLLGLVPSYSRNWHSKIH